MLPTVTVFLLRICLPGNQNGLYAVPVEDDDFLDQSESWKAIAEWMIRM
jgi:hypothetical protein